MPLTSFKLLKAVLGTVWKSSLAGVKPYTQSVALSPNMLSHEFGTLWCKPVTPDPVEPPGAGRVHGKQAELAAAQCQ